MFCDASTLLLERELDMEVLVQVGKSEAACAAMREYHADVVIMGITVPYLSAVKVVRAMKARHVGVRIIGLATYMESTLAAEMLSAGVSGNLMKDCPLRELLIAIDKLTGRNLYHTPYR